MAFSNRRSFSVTATLLATTAILASSQTAHAQGFLDRIFNPKRYEQKLLQQQQVQEREAAPPVRVSSPQYFTYSPDAPKTVSLKGLAAAPKHERAEAPASSEAGTSQPVDAEFEAARAALADISIRALPEVSAAVIAHYSANPAFIWIAGAGVSTKARAAMVFLSEADRFGLDPADYRVAEPAITDNEDENRAALMRYEMELSAGVLAYVLDATRGRIDPNRLSGYHDLPRKDVDLQLALRSLAASQEVTAYLESRNPQNEPFKALVAALAKLKTEDEGKHVVIAEGTLLKPGKDNKELPNVVAAIRLQGSDDLKTKHAEILAAYNGAEAYTDDLVALVKDFQKENGLTADGVIGRNTIRAMQGVSNEVKAQKIRFAMERLRWLPRQLGARHVFINQPAFTATYREEGREPLTMRVVVGQKSNQTYFFSDTIETVEYNPYWGVPHSIIVNEMLPKLYEDPAYLDNIGYEVTTASGASISSASVDWHAVAQKKLPINVRQRPGDDNALGELKILFPNAHAIYMHDTPSKSLFQRDSRAFSHGCVRLENPRAMAAAVLGKPVDYIASRIAQGKNDSDRVAADISVHVAYFTAWPEDNGRIGYYDDVYGRDEHLEKAIVATARKRAE